jgi:hypothetical protein
VQMFFAGDCGSVRMPTSALPSAFRAAHRRLWVGTASSHDREAVV